MARPAANPNPLVRVLDELLWSLRRDGFVISPAQAIDAARAVLAVGVENHPVVRDAVASVVVQRASDRARFDAAFDAFFEAALPDASGRARPRRGGTLWERLAALGYDEAELSHLRAALEELALAGNDGLAPLGLLLGRGADLDRALALAGLARTIDAHSGLQLGFLSHRLLVQLGAPRGRKALGALRPLLVEALGARGDALADALDRELTLAGDEVRDHVRRAYQARVDALPRQPRSPETTPFVSLSDSEIDDVRRAVRRFADRLRGGARVRARRALRGRVDPHRTLRRALRTGGIPFRLARKRRHRDRPRLLLVCDVSDSVRAAACFLLEFVYAAQDLFARTRSFVFVSELGEATRLFEREPVRVAIARAWGGGVVPSGENSNYGRALRALESRHLHAIDRRTTVVILGDGRTNYLDAAPDVLDRIRLRARALLWLCPEPRGRWSEGDSAMPRYAPKCTAVYEVSSAADLERAARVIVRRA
jgi:uncharacterized protein with von Willebrand factor type A (vWA) domain